MIQICVKVITNVTLIYISQNNTCGPAGVSVLAVCWVGLLDSGRGRREAILMGILKFNYLFDVAF